MAKPELTARVIRAAEAALANKQHVCLIDVLGGMGLLSWNSVAAWRKGRIGSLYESIQGSPAKIEDSIGAFRAWAFKKGLHPSETDYLRQTPAGPVHLQFSASGDPAIEAVFKTHFVSSSMPEKTRLRLQQKSSAAPQIVVFSVLRDTTCSGCGAGVGRGGLLLLDAERPLCLHCARLDSLVFLESGDATRTRRATKYSAKTAVVVRFSRSRGRYERVGALVEPAGLERAETELLADHSPTRRRVKSGRSSTSGTKSTPSPGPAGKSKNPSFGAGEAPVTGKYSSA
jgi:hypothetical protein